MADDQTISRLLGKLYAAPTAPELWHDFLQDACGLIGVTKAVLLGHDTVMNVHRIYGSAGEGLPESNALYEERYWEHDEWTRRGVRALEAGQVLMGEEVWPEPELLRSVFYNEFLSPLDIREMACVAMGDLPRLFECLTFFRGNADSEFAPSQIAALEMLHPHLRTALATRRRLAALESRVGDLEAALNVLDSPLLLLDAFGRVVFVNEAARSILALGRDLRLVKSRLVMADVGAAAKLRDLAARAIATGTGKGAFGGGMMLVPRTAGNPLQLLVSPLRSESTALPRGAVAAVFINDPDGRQTVPAEVLRNVFGLTAAEARLALTLLDGCTLSEAADQVHVSRETVKTQMKAISGKTGSRRQADLVRLLSRLPALHTETKPD